jgi:hypothetical protein
MSVARLRFLPLVLLLWLLTGSSHQAISRQPPPAPAGRAMRVAFINMLAPTNPMQRGLGDATRAAGHDLGIDRLVRGVDRSPLRAVPSAWGQGGDPGLRPDGDCESC